MTGPMISRWALVKMWLEAHNAKELDDGAPSYSDYWQRHFLVSLLWEMWREDPGLIGGPTEEPRATWDAQEEDPNDAPSIADGQAALWP